MSLHSRKRLVDYVVIVGYNHEERKRRKRGRNTLETSYLRQGKILQRFPPTDWGDVPFIEGLEPFCQPNGWFLTPDRGEPQFFIAVLTDINGDRHYCAVLSFGEAVAKECLGEEPGHFDVGTPDETEEDGARAPPATGAADECDVGGGGDEELEPDMTVTSGPMSLHAAAIAAGAISSLPRHIVPGVSLPALPHDALMFAPKCIALLSRHDDPETLRNCLSVIYTAYSECLVGQGGERVKLETLIGNLLGSVYVPGPGGPQVRFSLGASDKILMQPPVHSQVPVTGTKVALLFQQLGIRNVLTLFCAALTELKILFYSQSYNRLTDSCTALVALMYPMKYMHSFIPILPAAVGEMWGSPMPFIIGVHASRVEEIVDLLDVVKVDLDGGTITVPENMTIPLIPGILMSKVLSELSSVLHPELVHADDAFPAISASTITTGLPTMGLSSSRKPIVLDKELRAVMLRLMVHLLSDYRSCLILVRIHPKPFITFHKAGFLGMKNHSDSLFVRRMLDCMFFNTFVSERGLPWRNCDIFDDLHASYSEHCAIEREDPAKIALHIKILAEELYRNENPLTTLNQPYSQKIPVPAEGAMRRVHQPIFPRLDEILVQELIDSGVHRNQMEPSSSPTAEAIKRIVPMGGKEISPTNLNGVPASATTLALNSARRLGVLRSCITSIFENKIAEAKKTFPAVISALKAKQARLALVEELEARKTGPQVLLEHQQFDMVVRLMNASLQDDSDMDLHGIASALLPLSTAFGRKLARGVLQFAYTLIQDHAVWQNQTFWEAAYFADVQKELKNLYSAFHDQNSNQTKLNEGYDRQPACEKSVLELSAFELRMNDSLTNCNRKERADGEEQTVYSQAFVYIHNMIYLLCPLDMVGTGSPRRRKYDDFENAASNSISNSMAETDSLDGESGFEEQEMSNGQQQIIKSVLRFAEKVCNESQVPEQKMRVLEDMIRSTVSMHMEQLEEVSREARRLPPIQKPKINAPSLLPGEEFVVEKGLRAYLLPDGRAGAEEAPSGVALLPAEGALFLTSYRVIFKGSPIDPFAAEHTVTRFFPVSSLTKEKRLTMNKYLTEIDQQLKEGIQLRSNTFQLIRAAFDDEVTMEEIDEFRRSLQRVQFPEHIYQLFAFRGIHNYVSEPLGGKGREKNSKYATSAIRGFATKTLKNVGKVTGYQSKKRKTSKYFLPNMMPTPGRLSIAEMQTAEGKTIREEDESGELTTHIHHPVQSSSSSSSNTKTLERVMERSYFRDWLRLKLIPADYTVSPTSNGGKSAAAAMGDATFRVSTINFRYQLAMTYPALLLVPSKIGDESLRRYARCHRHSRFPAITWRHPKNHSLLLRGSGFHGRGVISMLRRQQQHNDPGHLAPSTGQQEMASSVEAERFTMAVIHATPKAAQNPTGSPSAWNMSGSELSINSLMVSGGGGSGTASGEYGYATLTPTMSRKLNPITKAYGTLTRGTAAPKFTRLSLSNMKGSRTLAGSQTSLTNASNRASSRYSTDHSATGDATSVGGGGTYEGGVSHILKRAALYIFGDKNQMKGAKLDAPGTEFIPVEYPGPSRIRTAFKKLMWACVPSSTAAANKNDQTFLKQVETSEWLPFLEQLMQISGAVVDVLDMQGASVMVCLEDGWDISAQICSIAMLCQDPFYRTIEGFRVLVEKEWLAFGHRFMTRNNLQNRNDHGFTPLFLQFLDVVHQIHSQFPMAFEFNQYYLKFLAYHHVSCRFRTFLLDNEYQMKEFGFLVREKNSSMQRTQHHGHSADSHSSDEDTFPGPTAAGNNNPNLTNTLKGNNVGVDLFDYIDVQSARTPVFHNFLYSRDLSSCILRPFSHISDLKVWDYYCGEALKHGAPYDVELYLSDLQEQQREQEMSDTASIATTSVIDEMTPLTNGYDFVDRISSDCCTALLAEIDRLEAEIGVLPNKWKFHFGSCELPPPLPPRPDFANPVLLTTPSVSSRSNGKMMHKRSTIELILNGGRGTGGAAAAGTVAVGMGAPNASFNESGSSFAHTHRFDKFNYPTTTVCEVCNSMLWGPVTPGIKCSDCGYNCHEKCRENILKPCSGRKSIGGYQREPGNEGFERQEQWPGYSSDRNSGALVADNHLGAFHGGGRGSAVEDEDFAFDHFSPSTADENGQILIQDYLYKQANFKIKGWKPRWFILDATKHQLRYADTREDYRDKGYIDLSEVTGVCKVSDGGAAGAGAPKNAEGCMFELQTVRRTYCFCAKNRTAAHEWISKIQSCLSNE